MIKPNALQLARCATVARVIGSGKEVAFAQIAILAKRLKVSLHRPTTAGAWDLVVDVQDQPGMCRRAPTTGNASESISLKNPEPYADRRVTRSLPRILATPLRSDSNSSSLSPR